MGVPNSQLLGKKVYTPDGSYQGEVMDTGFVLGSGDPLLIVKTNSSVTVEVPWGKVVAAKDIVILAEGFDISGPRQTEVALRESQPASPSASVAEKPKLSVPVGRMFGRLGRGKEAVACPTCGKPASWIKQYGRWYCYQDKKYL